MSTWGEWHEVEHDELCVRVLDRRARRPAVIHERLGVHEPGIEVVRGAVAQVRNVAVASSSDECVELAVDDRAT